MKKRFKESYRVFDLATYIIILGFIGVTLVTSIFEYLFTDNVDKAVVGAIICLPFILLAMFNIQVAQAKSNTENLDYIGKAIVWHKDAVPKAKLSDLKEIHKIQADEGNYNYDQYMYGIHVGMELALATIEGRAPEYKKCPKTWVADESIDAHIESGEPITAEEAE